MSLYPIGPCCVGTKCIHSNGELRPNHKCAICKQIVHMLCAVTNPNSDAWTCKECHDDSKTETYHGSDAGSDKDKSIIENMTVTVDKIMDEEFTTITESVKDKTVKHITKDYFVTKRQRVNKEMKEMDPDWEDLRTRVNKMIDSALKEEMVVEAQRINLKYAEKDQMVMVQNFREIGKSWKMDGSVSNAKKINQVAYGVFGSKKNIGYEYYLETSIMKELKLEYSDLSKGRGCIASMISRRKADLAKCVMKRSELTHQTKITKKRTHAQTEVEGLRNKKAKFAFQIKGNDGDQWYNTDGRKYSDKFIQEEESVNEVELKEKIKELQLELTMSKKVEFSVHLIVLLCFVSL